MPAAAPPPSQLDSLVSALEKEQKASAVRQAELQVEGRGAGQRRRMPRMHRAPWCSCCPRAADAAADAHAADTDAAAVQKLAENAMLQKVRRVVRSPWQDGRRSSSCRARCTVGACARRRPRGCCRQEESAGGPGQPCPTGPARHLQLVQQPRAEHGPAFEGRVPAVSQ